MPKVIFGSGVVGLLARYVLGDDWQVVPFGKSRFYTFLPPLADNYLCFDQETEDVATRLARRLDIRDFGQAQYRRAYSYRGELTKTHDEVLCGLWLRKIFGDAVPPHAPLYWSKRMTQPIYRLRTNNVYRQLIKLYEISLKAEAAKGDVTEIGPHYFIRQGERVEFEKAVSTIPLTALQRLMRRPATLATLPIYYHLIRSDAIDLEGMNQVLVADEVFDFYKVTNIDRGLYLFYSVRDIPVPGAYFMPIIGQAEIIDGTRVDGAIPAGSLPDLREIEAAGIYCIGAHAQHDWCADVGSNLLKIVRYANRGCQP